MPVDAPPLPYREGIISLLARDEFRKQPQALDRAAQPPDFIGSTYADALIAAGMAIYAVEEINRPVVPGFSSRVIDQLSNEKLGGDKKALAFYLLSEVTPRDTNSIQAAIKWIDFKVNVPHSDPKWRNLHPWSSYPARDALLRIGEVSVGPIVQDLPGETNGLRRQLLCAVVSTFGRTNWTTAWQPKPAIEHLRQMRATETDAVRQQNIDAALGLLIDNKVDLNIGWSGYFEE